MWQTQILPNDNSNHEFRHYQDVVDDLQNLQNVILSVGTRGNAQGADVNIGTRYPSRIVLVNPGPVTGHLETEGTRTVSFENIRAVGSEATNTREVWKNPSPFTDISTGIVTSAEYNYNSDETLPPLVVTGESVYSVSNGSVISHSDQTLIDGNRIRLTFISGTLDASGQDASVIVEPQSSSVRTVTITGNDSDKPIEIRLDPPPRVSATAWIEEYEPQLNSATDRITNISDENGQIVLKLAPQKTYHVQLTSVKVGSEKPESDRLNASYIIKYDGHRTPVTTGQVASVTAEVRDRFNNPVREAEVIFHESDGAAVFLDEEGELMDDGENLTVQTDSEGRARAEVFIDQQQSVSVTALIANRSGSLNRTEFDLHMIPGGTSDLFLSVSQINADGPGADDVEGVSYSVRNLDSTQTMTIKEFRIHRTTAEMSRFDRDNNAGNLWQYPLTIDVGNNGNVNGYIDVNQLQVGTNYLLNTSGQEATIGPRKTARFRHWESGNPGDDMTGAFMEVTIVFRMEDDEENSEFTSTIFVF